MPKNKTAAETTSPNEFTLTLTQERETKGTVVYGEADAEKPHKFYIRKDKLPKVAPDTITMVVSWGMAGILILAAG